MNIIKNSGVKMETEPGKPTYLKFSQNTILSHFHAFGYGILFARNVSQNLRGVGWGVTLVHIYIKRREAVP